MKKIFFYICTFVLVSFTVESKKLGSVSENYNTCLTENNVSDDDMLTVRDITHDQYKSESQERLNKNGCVMQCLLQKAGLMEDAEYKVEKMHSEFIKKTNVEPGNKRLECLDTCINESKDLTEKCEKAFRITACFMKAEHKHKHEQENKSEN
ncbi:Pheromone-binding protein Gp-9 [Trachymyrmex zeteki]|uniref:Pheromone-binding protein Gp-9 n=1 Tax=Mycetomoellerius zeteki TaxID=64791 RepID=A0A151WKD0_9HYME|nr:PREDICTED: pheromone-binding protein Gp-9-like isoform X2 [Trachymyrmex zeteki]KYQ48333.1 Pheromone-binding protein Gp-9 [Trachymyrmex zeteki]